MQGVAQTETRLVLSPNQEPGQMKTLTRTLSKRVRLSVERSRERREHDRAMTDPRIRDEHFAARAREVAGGGSDCYFCA